MLFLFFLIKNVAQFLFRLLYIQTFVQKMDGHVHIVGSVVLVAIITMVYIMYMLIKTHSSNSSIHRKTKEKKTGLTD